MIVAIDTETGGLVPGYHALLQLAAVPSWDAEPFCIYIWPSGLEVAPEAARKNGYSPERWEERGAVRLPDALELLWDWLQKAPVPVHHLLPLAHNAGFDRSFLDASYAYVGRKNPLGHRWRCSQAALAYLQDAGVLNPSSLSLDALAGLCGLQREGKEHNALEDARLCLSAYHWLIGLPEAQREAAVAIATTPGHN